MVRLMAFLSLLALLVPADSIAQPALLGGGPPERVAHPPIHVRGASTTSPTGYSPTQIRQAYGFASLSSAGYNQVIGIVDAYDDPTAAEDLGTFIGQYSALFSSYQVMHGITDSCTVTQGPHPCFQKLYAAGSKPHRNSGWALEISLDVQWAHAIAPEADVLLVEANSDGLSDLLNAVDVAASSGAKVVSMSWGTYEFSSESSYDFHFTGPGVTFIAASGDTGTPLWPAASPNVVGVGGTTLPLDSSGNLQSGATETAWGPSGTSFYSSGGGVSLVEPVPSYQSGFPIPNGGGMRGIPDVSYDADPSTGVSIYDSTPYNGQTGWFTVGGTSVGAPQWAALIALADQLRGCQPVGSTGCLPSGTSTLLSPQPLYAAAGSATSYNTYFNYRDITQGCNLNLLTGSSFCAQPGYDFVTGLGSPLANNLVTFLATH